MIKWHVDATFAIHKDMKSHTGAMHYDSWLWYHLLHLYETKR
jgi:hypothetical protein